MSANNSMQNPPGRQRVSVNRLLHRIIALCALALLAGCVTGPRISTDYDPQADFSRYQTWAYYQPITMEDAGYATLVTERIRSGVQREMEQRGYRYAEASPDLRVNFQMTVQDRIRASPGFYDPFSYAYGGPWSWGGPWGWGRSWGGYGRYGGGYGYGPQYVDTYREGKLVIDMVDAAQNRLVWTGTAASRVGSPRTAQERAQTVDIAVDEILKQYPYRAGSAQPMNMPAQ